MNKKYELNNLRNVCMHNIYYRVIGIKLQENYETNYWDYTVVTCTYERGVC